MKINLNHIKDLLDEYDSINKPELKELEFEYNGKPVTIPKETIESWRFVGLNNISFIRELFTNLDKK